MGGRPAMRPQLDGALKLDLGRLRRQGWIVPGGSTSGTLVWRNGAGEQRAAIGFTVTVGADSGSVRLRYTTTLHDGREVASDYSVALVAVPQPFGGVRWWFCCPATGGRAAVMYLPPGRTRFASQRALRGSYRVQRVGPKDRALEAAQGIRMALGGSPNMLQPFPSKPPRMWWSTYQRRRERAERAEGRSLAFLAAYVDRLSPGWRERAAAGRG